MRLDAGLVAGHRKQHLGDPVSYIVLYDELEQKQRNQHSHTGKYQKAPFVRAALEAAVERAPDDFYGTVKDDSGAPGEYADNKTQVQKFVLFRYFP